MTRQTVSSGTPWEKQVGYSRAVRAGNMIFISGTTASDEAGNTLAQGDAYQQAKFILLKIERTLKEAGATLSDVVRTRMFVTDIRRWEEIGRAHAEAFGNIRPAATMVEVQGLVNPDHLVEIEADAIIS
jgi:enamine deaminase RidA (YjgF/YER057c/UK114 family)